MANRYWFARRFPVGQPGDRMDPVSREGWMVVWVFAAALVAGFVALLVFTLAFQKPLIGFIILLVLTSLGMTALLMLSKQRGDHKHTAAEYKAGTVTHR
jgi:membrane protein implicated in regulation of membrane protease activity